MLTLHNSKPSHIYGCQKCTSLVFLFNQLSAAFLDTMLKHIHESIYSVKHSYELTISVKALVKGATNI